jgi:hypothetical protein
MTSLDHTRAVLVHRKSTGPSRSVPAILGETASDSVTSAPPCRLEGCPLHRGERTHGRYAGIFTGGSRRHRQGRVVTQGTAVAASYRFFAARAERRIRAAVATPSFVPR